MRPVCLAIAALLGIEAVPTLAQSTTQGREYGLYVGAGYATLNDSGIYNIDARKMSFVVGGLARLPVRPGLMFQPELLLNWKHARTVSTNAGQTTTSSESFNYLELPLLLRVGSPTATGSVALYGLGGPFVALKSQCYDEGSCSGYGTDIGGVIGAGMDWRTYTVTARYELGTTPLLVGSASKNRGWVVLLGKRW